MGPAHGPARRNLGTGAVTLSVRRCPDAAAFLMVAEPFLLRAEAAHNLILGLAGQLRGGTRQYLASPYLAVVMEGEAVVGAVLRTPPHNLILSTAPREALPAIAATVRAEFVMLPGLIAPAEISRAFAAEWQRVSGQAYHLHVAERVFQLDAVIPVQGVPGAVRQATERDRAFLLGWLLAFRDETVQRGDRAEIERSLDARLHVAPEIGGLWVWEDGGEAVSLAGYGGPTAHGIRIGPVYTPPAHRGRGYASANVAALSQWLLDSGRRFCFLFTDLANPTANGIYRQIGYRPVCDMDEYAFLPVPGAA